MGKGHSLCCKVFCCLCCCFTLVLLAVGLAAAVIYSGYQDPEVDVTSAKFESMSFSPSIANPTEVRFTTTVDVYINNPNSPPLEGKVTKLFADVFSLDKTAVDETGRPVKMGDTELPEPVEVKAESETTFKLTVTGTMKTSDSEQSIAIQRLARDCGALGSGKTRIRANVKDVVVTVYGFDVPMSDLDIDTDVDCP